MTPKKQILNENSTLLDIESELDSPHCSQMKLSKRGSTFNRPASPDDSPYKADSLLDIWKTTEEDEVVKKKVKRVIGLKRPVLGKKEEEELMRIL